MDGRLVIRMLIVNNQNCSVTTIIIFKKNNSKNLISILKRLALVLREIKTIK